MIEGKYSTNQVWIDGKELSSAKSQKVRNHSPDGFSWGYGGSGPSQFSLAILLAFGLEFDKALQLYMDFKWHIIAKLPQGDFKLKKQVIQEWINQHNGGR